MSPLSAPRVTLDRRRQFTLLKVADVVFRHHRPGELFSEISPLLRSIVGFDFINLSLNTSSRKVTHYLWEGREGPRAPFELGIEDEASAWVWQHQKVLAIQDVTSEKRFEQGLQWFRDFGLRSYCLFPLTTPQQRLGTLGFSSRRPHAFVIPDLELLRLAAEMVAISLDKTLTPVAIASERARLRLLLEVDTAARRGTNLQEDISFVLRSVERWAPRDFVGVYLPDGDATSLDLYMTNAQLSRRFAPNAVAPVEGSLAGQVFRTGRVEVRNHRELGRCSLDTVKRGLDLGVRSLCMVPLTLGKEVFGVLKVARQRNEPFTPRDIALLKHVADAVAPRFQRTAVVGSHTRSSPSPAHGGNGVVRNQIEDLEWMSNLGEQDSLIMDSEKLEKFGLKHLSDSEPLMASYFSASTVGFCVLDSNLRYLAINNSLASMNGVPAQEHLGRSIQEILGGLGRTLAPKLLRMLASGDPVLSLELTAKLPHRSEPGHWVGHYFPVKNADGKAPQIGLVVVEITDQKKHEGSLRAITGKLRREKRQLEALLETGRLLATDWDVRKTFSRISAYLRRGLRHEYASLALLDEEKQALIEEALDFPLGKGLAQGLSISIRGPRGRALRDGKAMILSKREMQESQLEVLDKLLDEGLKSLCFAPLTRPGKMLGVVSLGSTRDGAFTIEDLPVVNQIAAQLAIAVENSRAAEQLELLRNRLAAEKRYLEGEIRTREDFEEIIGESSALKQVLNQVHIVAGSVANVLIQGETGTGKELIARAIHRNSKRKDRSFVKLNCAAIPTGLLESELFGHEKGAFTGAISQKIGRLELAEQGTLFLDEIGEIPLELQPKLLRVLQDHEFERLGSTRTIKVDLRLIAATNRDLAKGVAEGNFRSDLFYRLNVFPIRTPALRERRTDIPILVHYMVEKFAKLMNRKIETIPTETMNALMNWHWPGNVRELENLIERSVILSDGPTLRVPLGEFQVEQRLMSGSDTTLENAEREHIIGVLRETSGFISGAARRLGLKRTTLQSKMKKLHIKREDYSQTRRI